MRSEFCQQNPSTRPIFEMYLHYDSITMWQFLELLLRRCDALRHRRNVGRALALHLRGEARRDGLRLDKLCHRLEIQWRARDIHPWDRELVGARERRPLFFEQSLTDTEAAIFRLFKALPVVDVLDITILDHTSDSVIIAGTVYRSMLEQGRNLLSVRMRLREMGVTYYSAGAEVCIAKPKSSKDDFGEVEAARSETEATSPGAA